MLLLIAFLALLKPYLVFITLLTMIDMTIKFLVMHDFCLSKKNVGFGV